MTKRRRRPRPKPNQRGPSREEPHHEERLSTGEVRQRAVTGAAVDILRGFGVRALGFVGTLVLARLLTPHDFGLVAIGVTLVTFAQFLADGGIGSGLIRRVEPPERDDLRALLGFQLVLASALAVGISLALLPFGLVGQLTAVMATVLPLMAIRAPGVILLERQLAYKTLAIVDIVESLCNYACAIVLVVAGWGVWALAVAQMVRGVAGTVTLLAIVPAARMVPRLSWARVRPLLKFGIQYQTVGVVGLLRDQGTNAAVAFFAGVPALGAWTVAYRILQVPLLFLGSLWRVSFPAMSKLVAAGEDVGPTIERIVAVVAVASGLLLAPLVAATPAWVPALLGDQWVDIVPVIPPACLHLMVVGTINVALWGYLYALGEAGAVLRATMVGVPLMAVVMIPLLILIGVPAVGFGWLATGVGEATVLILAARKHSEFSITPRIVPPTIAASIGAVAGWLVAVEVGTTVLGGLVGALLATLVYLLGLWIWHRSYLIDSVRLAARGLRQVLKPQA